MQESLRAELRSKILNAMDDYEAFMDSTHPHPQDDENDDNRAWFEQQDRCVGKIEGLVSRWEVALETPKE